MTNSVFSKRIEDTINARVSMVTDRTSPFIAGAIFGAAYANTEKTLKRKDEWFVVENLVVGPDSITCTDYDNKVGDACLKIGTMAKIEEVGSDPTIIIATRLGIVAVVERQEGSEHYYTHHCSSAFYRAGYLKKKYRNNLLVLNTDQLLLLLGSKNGPVMPQPHIGQVLETVYGDMLRPQRHSWWTE